MPDTITKETIEITDHEMAPAAPAAPTRDDLKAKGWTAAEMESAEKHGMVAKPEDAEAKKKEAEEKAKTDAEAKTKADEEAKAKDAKDKGEGRRAEDKLRNDIPDFTFKTPEQEKAWLEAFGPGTPQRGLYFRMKNERLARQSEKTAREAADKRVADLEAEVKALRVARPTLVDEDGNPIDPDEKPLTLKEWKAMQTAEKAEQDKKNTELNERARIVSEAQSTQEEYARSIYADFDETVEKAKDVMKNLEALIPEKWKQTKVVKLVRDLQIAAANADKIDLDEYHAAHIAYEIGQFHPDYGKKADDANPNNNGDASEKDGKPIDPKKGHGTLTPEQMKRIEENTRQRASSASVTGGAGKRTISVEDVDLSTLNKMSYSERQRFREKHPDRYAKLLRA